MEVISWRTEYPESPATLEIANPEPPGVFLEDRDAWEIMVNGPVAIFTKRHACSGGYNHQVFGDEHVV
jgi:hypothetical protein